MHLDQELHKKRGDRNSFLTCFSCFSVLFLKVILSVSSKTPVVRSRLGEQVLLDCGFWVDPSSPLHGSGFSIEWRYQFRGEGRLVVAYDGKNDRFAETSETGADIDVTALYDTGNASLILEEAQVRHSGTYICTVYLPHLLAQVAVDLEIVGKLIIYIYIHYRLQSTFVK